MTEQEPTLSYEQTSESGTSFNNGDRIDLKKAGDRLKTLEAVRAARLVGQVAGETIVHKPEKTAVSPELMPMVGASEWTVWMRRQEYGSERQDDYGLTA